MHRIEIGYYLIIFGALLTVCSAVRITSFSVPSSYIIEDEGEPGELILDCAYETTEPNEKGIVLQWLLNETLIYQWLPQENATAPHTFTNMRHYIDTNYTVAGDELQRYRALAIAKPMKNMTGEYTCSVGSYKNDDKRKQYLQMIVPEADLILKVDELPDRELDDELSIECIAKNIYPEPKLSIVPDTGKFVSRSRFDLNNGLYSTTVFGTVRTNQTSFTCNLKINGTDYMKSINRSANDAESPTSESVGSRNMFALSALLPMYIYFVAHSMGGVFH